MTFPRYFISLAVLLAAVSVPAFQQPAHEQKNNPPPAPPAKQQGAAPEQPKPAPPRETFWQKALRILGISVTPSALKGDDDALTGDIWLADLQTGTARRLTREGTYRSPIVLPGEQTVWALKAETICEIPLDGGAVKERFSIKGIIKLASVDTESRKNVVLLREDEAHQMVVELLSIYDGKRTVLSYDPASDADKRMLAYLRSWERSYDGGKFKLYTRSESRDGAADRRIEWRDVYFEGPEREPLDLSHCEPFNCGQPALSLNAQYAVYVKAL